MPFRIIRNDITKVKADAIVNTANPEPIIGGGTDGAIYMAAGEELLLAERKKIGRILPGQVAVTPAFALPATYIIHTVGPVWVDGKHGEEETLKVCYERSLKKAYALKCRSIAFPLISTGVYGFPKDKGLQVALAILQDFALHHRMDICLVIFDADSYELSGKVFSDIRSYIDDNYVAESAGRNYDVYEQEAGHIRDRLFEFRRQMDRRHSHMSVAHGPVFHENIIEPEYIPEEENKTFQEKLLGYIDAADMKDSEVYKPLHLSKQMFSKLRGNIYYQPSRKAAILFCLRLKLSLEDTQDLLSRAGFAFNPSNKSDMAVKAFIKNKKYDLYEIDLFLDQIGCPMLLEYGDKDKDDD